MTYKDTCEIFERMEISEQVYVGGNTSKNTNRVEADHTSHGRKRKVLETASLANPKKGRDGKCKKNHAGHPSDRMTGAKTCLVHGLRHSTKECKLLKEWSKKYYVQRPHKDKEARSGGSKNCAKAVNFYGHTQEINAVVSHDAHISRNKTGKSRTKILRVRSMLQSSQRRDTIMVLTA